MNKFQPLHAKVASFVMENKLPDELSVFPSPSEMVKLLALQRITVNKMYIIRIYEYLNIEFQMGVWAIYGK